jgi:tRNA (uracil-5-)-methyltransferase TRM9
MDFLNTLKKDSLLVDLGCGKGVACLHWLRKGGLACVGLDASIEMLREALSTLSRALPPPLLIAGDIKALPFKDRCFDAALLVSVLHHLITKEDRVNALRELKRVLKEGGVALVSVWARYQPYIIVKVLKAFLKGCRGDSFWDTRICSSLGCRYYHFYSMKELVNDAKEAGLKIIDSGVYEAPGKGSSRKNYFIIVGR